MTRLGTIMRRTCRPIKDTDRFSLTPEGREALEAAETATEAAEPVQSVRQAYDGPAEGQPRPGWTRGTCPACGGAVVANMYYVGGRGYLCIHECWESLGTHPTCNYRKVL